LYAGSIGEALAPAFAYNDYLVPRMTLPTQLSHFERSDLIQLADVQPELEYLFRHTLIKDAIYQARAYFILGHIDEAERLLAGLRARPGTLAR
jgi:hypothetical protein